MKFSIAAVATAVALSFGGSANAAPAASQPFSWDNATIYFVMTDRFNNGNPGNDHAYGRKDDGAPAGAERDRQWLIVPFVEQTSLALRRSWRLPADLARFAA